MEQKTPSWRRPRTRTTNYSGTPPVDKPPGKRGNFSSDEEASDKEEEPQVDSPLRQSGQAASDKTNDTAQIPRENDNSMDEEPVSLIDLPPVFRRPKVPPYSNWNEYLEETFDDHGTQSDNLKEHISAKLSGMLNLLTEVNQRELTRDRRAIPVESPNGTKKPSFYPSIV